MDPEKDWDVEAIMKIAPAEQMERLREYSKVTGQPVEEMVVEAMNDWLDALILKELNDWEAKGCLRNVEADKNRHNKN